MRDVNNYCDIYFYCYQYDGLLRSATHSIPFSLLQVSSSSQNVDIADVWGQGLHQGLEAIKFYGGATVGMRTLLDALEPGILSLRAGGQWGAIYQLTRKVGYRGAILLISHKPSHRQLSIVEQINRCATHQIFH